MHPLAEQTAARLSRLRAHPAVQDIAAASSQWPFLLIVPHVLRWSWPDFRSLGVVEPWADIPSLDAEEFRRSFQAFAEMVEEGGLWRDTASLWEEVVQDLRSVLAERDLAGFLALFWGKTGRAFVAVPNPLAPRSNWIGISAPDAHYAILPPPLLAPDAPEPVAYRSRPFQTRSGACHELSHSPEFLARQRVSDLGAALEQGMARTPASKQFRERYPGATWQFSEILLRAVQVSYLRRHEDPEAEARFLKWHREAEGLESLVAWANMLDPYLEGRKTGRYEGWGEYLPTFVGALRTRR